METNNSLRHQVSREKLVELLKIHGEEDHLDFKQVLDMDSNRARAEIARDFLAFTNTDGGGHIVIGVEDSTFEPVGLPTGVCIDSTKIYQAISRYIEADIPFMAAEYELDGSELGSDTWDSKRRFGIVYIAWRPGISKPRCDAAFDDRPGKPITVLNVRDVLVRRGAQSCHANQSDIDRLFRSLESHSEGSDEQRRPLDSNLPAREEIAVDFVGRTQELSEINRWFRDPHRRRWLLAGDGGKGKTAIAYEFATRAREEAPDVFVCCG